VLAFKRRLPFADGVNSTVMMLLLVVQHRLRRDSFEAVNIVTLIEHA